MSWTRESLEATALRMVQRYGSKEKAADAATDHAMSYGASTRERTYWTVVREEILRRRTVEK